MVRQGDMYNEKYLMAFIRPVRPSFTNNYDALAFAVHASFMASDFSLTATGQPAFSNDALDSTSTDEILVDGWNELVDEYAFVYMHSDNGSKKVLVKCLATNGTLYVDALADGKEECAHVAIDIGEYIADNRGTTTIPYQYKNMEKLMKNLNKEIFSRVVDPPIYVPTSLEMVLRSNTALYPRKTRRSPGDYHHGV